MLKSDEQVDNLFQTSTWEESLADFVSGSTGPVHFVGLGSPVRQDDGVGPAVIKTLIKEVGKKNSNLIFHTPEPNPERLIGDLASGTDRVVIFDAVQAMKPGGQIVSARVDDTKYGFFATHNVPLRLIPGLSQAKDRFLLVGIQPVLADVGEGLSKPVEESMRKIVELVRSISGELNG
ncbi:MAG TPA: hydrogenase maturation protease [Nitrososphaerales archaeon]|nr:hydrogenase maturation protease [Nitrososphaerales archaeon]